MAIAEIANQYMEALSRGVEIILVYDRTSLSFTREVTKNGQTYKLTVLSSGKYGNSDDALVDWAA